MITTRLLRHINALRCLRLLQGGAVMSRADMARVLGQTRATVGHAVTELVEARLVIEAEPPRGTAVKAVKPEKPGVGRPGISVRLNPLGAQFIGIEIDTRAISGVLLNLDMHVAHRLIEPAGPDFHDPAAMRRKIVAMAKSLAAGTDPSHIHGLGLAVPGLVGRQGQIVNAPILGWRHVPMQDALRQSMPPEWTVEVGNDAFAFASAELASAEVASAELATAELATAELAGADLTGIDPVPANLLMVLLAEGIGSAHVAGARLITGAHGFAGELGHMRISLHDRAAKFEALAGAAAFPEAMGQGRAVSEGVSRLLASRDQPATQKALTLWAEALAAGLANAAHLLDPDRIVLGGPLARLYPLVASRVEANFAARMLEGGACPTLHLSRFGSEGAAIGAAARLRDRLFTLPDLDDLTPAKSR